ncbi:MAG TPA: hypothetical protein GX503_00255 [Clostridiales bacterium]|nr:hypothetical protein [Clostridiales bacterium]
MKISRKKIAILLILGLLIMAFAVGCGAPAEENTDEPAAEENNAQADNAAANQEEMNRLVGEKVMSIAATASLLLNGELGDLHEQVVADGHRNSEAYEKIRDVLRKVQEINNSTYVYTLIKVSDDMTHLIVDAADEEDADEFGTEYEMEPQFEKAFAGEPAYAIHTWEDETYGIQKSAFAPIYNSKGEIVAILGVDHPAPELGLIE